MSVPVSASSYLARNLTVVKSYFRKPLALLISVLSLLTLILEFLYTSKSSEPIAQGISSFLKGLKINYEVTPPNMIMVFLISGVCTACFFMIYFFSANPSGNPSIFFTILHIISVVELIGLAIISLITTIFGLVSILSVKTVIEFLGKNVEGLDSLNVEEISRNIDAYKTSMFLSLFIWIVFCAFILVYVNAQTGFLKSCKRTCIEPSVHYKGAATYGNLSMAFALIQLVFVVIAYLSLSNSDSGEGSLTIDFNSFQTLMLAYTICNAVCLLLKGSFVKKWEQFAKDNEIYVPATASSRISADSNPIATFKATTRRSNDAIKQSQPYLYGEEPNSDPNKKSSYIPEELQNDYPDPGYQQPPQGGMMNDPFMGADPFAGDPFGQDPFGQSPMGNPYGQPPMGNPYGQPPMDPNGGNPYNNGMM